MRSFGSRSLLPSDVISLLRYTVFDNGFSKTIFSLEIITRLSLFGRKGSNEPFLYTHTHKVGLVRLGTGRLSGGPTSVKTTMDAVVAVVPKIVTYKSNTLNRINKEKRKIMYIYIYYFYIFYVEGVERSALIDFPGPKNSFNPSPHTQNERCEHEKRIA